MPDNLRRITMKFYKNSEDIRYRLKSHDSTSGQDVAKFQIIRLLDQWSRFNRDLVIASAIGGCLRGSGARLVKGPFTRPLDVMIAARTTHRGTLGMEPRWHDASESIRVAQKLALPNTTDIAAAIGSAHSPANTLRLLRNHFAHESSHDCISKWNIERSTRFRTIMPPVDLIFDFESGGIRRFELWINALQDIAAAASN